MGATSWLSRRRGSGRACCGFGTSIRSPSSLWPERKGPNGCSGLRIVDTWGSDGVIVIAKGSTLQNDVDARSEGAPATLATVSVSTGQWEPLTRLDASRGETGHYWPQFLPDGRHIAFQVNSTNPKQRGVFITSLDAPQERRRLLSDLTTVAFVHDRVVF